MSKRKGVSAEEKKSRMLQLFYEKKEFYQLKDLEKIAPKEKGIVAQSVKDVLQRLVDDGLVDSDKIGTSTYFWAFPSKASHNKKTKIAQLEIQLAKTKTCLIQTKEKIIEAKIGREEFPARIKTLEMNNSLKSELANLTAELKKYENEGSANLETLKEDIEVAKDSANRWTDNLFSIKSWCKNKFSIDENVMNKQFGISPDLDYVE